MKNLPRLTLLATLLAGSTTVLAQSDGAPVPADQASAQPPQPVVSPSPVAEVPPQPLPPQPQSQQPLPPPSQSAVAEPSVNGFAFEIRLDTAQFVNGSRDLSAGFSPGLFLGYRNRAVTFGVGLELLRVTEAAESAGVTDEAIGTSFIVLPGVRFVLARSADEKNELLGLADVGYGLIINSRTTSQTDPPNITRIRAQAGLGMRHWITPSFAIGGTAGLRFDRQSVTDPNGSSGPVDQSLSLTSLFTSLQLTGVF
jgi:hypothetical protein